ERVELGDVALVAARPEVDAVLRARDGAVVEAVEVRVHSDKQRLIAEEPARLEHHRAAAPVPDPVRTSPVYVRDVVDAEQRRVWCRRGHRDLREQVALGAVVLARVPWVAVVGAELDARPGTGEPDLGAAVDLNVAVLADQDEPLAGPGHRRA